MKNNWRLKVELDTHFALLLIMSKCENKGFPGRDRLWRGLAHLWCQGHVYPHFCCPVSSDLLLAATVGLQRPIRWTWHWKGEEASTGTLHFETVSSTHLSTNVETNKPRSLRGISNVDAWVDDVSGCGIELGKHCGRMSERHPLPPMLALSPLWSAGLQVTKTAISPWLQETERKWGNKPSHLNCCDLTCNWDFIFVLSSYSPPSI